VHQFNEHHPELKGFSEYFQSEILPFLESREEERYLAVEKAKRYSAIIGIFAVGIFVFAALKKAPLNAYLIIGGGAFAIMSAVFAWQLKSLKAYTKDKIVGGICQYVGWRFRSKPAPLDISPWAILRLVPQGYERLKIGGGRKVEYEDEIAGQAHGAGFESIEVKLTRESGDDTVTDFRGQLMSITFPRQFLGRTIVLRNKGFLQGKKKGDMKRVGLVDPVFEKIFEAYGTDQVEARYLLTPVFMQTLVDLEHTVQGKNIRFGFDQNKLFIAVETGNRYEAGSMFEPLTSPARTQKILDEFGAVYDIVDVVSRAKRG